MAKRKYYDYGNMPDDVLTRYLSATLACAVKDVGSTGRKIADDAKRCLAGPWLGSFFEELDIDQENACEAAGKRYRFKELEGAPQFWR